MSKKEQPKSINTNGRKWFDVTIMETYHETYKILANSAEDAYDIANDLVNCGTIDPTGDNGDSYDREITDIDESGAPVGSEPWYQESDYN